jgi:hypothetical protein
LKRYLILVIALALPYSVWAHGGEDHGDAPAMAPIATSMPRVAATSEQFELVGVLDGKVLTVFLDEFGTNRPVVKAHIEVQSGSWTEAAVEVSPGVYSIVTNDLNQPGTHLMAFTVQAGDASDLLDATLEVGSDTNAPKVSQHAHYASEWAMWGGAAALLLAGVALALIRKRKHTRQH